MQFFTHPAIILIQKRPGGGKTIFPGTAVIERYQSLKNFRRTPYHQHSSQCDPKTKENQQGQHFEGSPSENLPNCDDESDTGNSDHPMTPLHPVGKIHHPDPAFYHRGSIQIGFKLLVVVQLVEGLRSKNIPTPK